ncbi:MAG: hypothetical protein AAFW73_21750 [Bacteroidota bacterium]
MENKFLSDLVSLNRVILENVDRQTPTVAMQRMARTAATINLEVAPKEPIEAAINEEYTTDTLRYSIITSNEPGSWTMEVIFNVNQVLERTPYVSMEFNPDYGISEFRFNPVSSTATSPQQYKALLHITSLEERDALLRALSDLNSGTTFVITEQTPTGITNVITSPKRFYFPPDLYPYIFQGILPPPTKQNYVLVRYAYEGLTYNYYQDTLRRKELFFLPDRYVMGKDPSTQMPTLALKVRDRDGELEVAFQMVLVAETNPQRILSAEETFRKEQADGELLRLNTADRTRFLLELPPGKTEIEDARIVLQSSIVASFVVPFEELNQLWDALFDRSPLNVLMKGEVKAELEGFNPEFVPVRVSLPEEYVNEPSQFIDIDPEATTSRKVTFISNGNVYDNPIKPAESILILIGGDTIRLTKEESEKTVEVKVPIIDIVLGNPDEVTYRYKVQTRYQDGSVAEADKQSQLSIIYVP